MKHKIFIDGAAGTTGLKIRELLTKREEIELVELPDAMRKDPAAKKHAFKEADLAILCLSDEAALESVALAQGSSVKIIDASSAHRTNPDWVYGLAEMNPNQREKIQKATYVSNPGCYPTGALLALNPLIAQGLLPTKTLINIFALSGYSGGGKNLIEAYETQSSNPEWSARPYALGLQHKHVPEITVHSGLETSPVFCPMVGGFMQGMIIQIPLHKSQIKGSGDLASQIMSTWNKTYDSEKFVTCNGAALEDLTQGGFLSPLPLVGTNQVELMAFGHSEQVVLVARLDNLGKGASGACVQNLNLMLGLPESAGLP